MATKTAVKPKNSGDTLLSTGAQSITKDQGSAIGGAIKAFEPAVVSSVAGEKNFQQNVQPSIDKANGYLTAAQQKAVEKFKSEFGIEDKGLPSDVQGELDEGKSDEELINDKRLAAYDRQQKDAQNLYDGLVLANNQAGAAQINALTGQWTERRQLLESSNKANESSWSQQFFRFGQAEYSPGMTSDMINTKEREGMRKVKELDDDYNSTVASINAATGQKNFAAAASLTQTLNQIEEKALDLMAANVKEARVANDKLRENQVKASRQNSIANLFAQGITDPAEILDYINYQDDGTMTGDITLDEIQDTLKIIDPSQNMTGVSADLKTFKYLQKDGGIPASWSYIDYLNATSNAKRKATTSGFVDEGESGPTYEEWYPDYLKTPEGKALAQQYGGSNNVELGKKLREAFAAQDVSRPDPKSNYTAGSIPAKVRSELENDITNTEATLADLYAAYPDVSSSYISSLFNSLRKKPKEGEMTDDDFKKTLEGLTK